ncbi:MAG: type II toxin-antitoxin system RelB/DinJ family antitoxin [Leptospirales bacterium]|nr:type II toxin-antitoxin system RelB/DinJ family antitoxin [Leptospirales bacterium]
MAQTNLTIRIDEDLKKEAEKLFSKIGLNMSSAVNVFFRQAVGAQAIPFELKAYDDYKTKIEESMRQAEEGKLIPLTLEEMEGLEDMDTDKAREFLLARRKETGL